MACNLGNLDKLIGVNERIKFFDESQGGQNKAIIWNGNLVWESGSNREIAHGDMMNLISMMDESWFDLTDFRQERLLLCWKQKFAEQKLEDTIKECTAVENELKARAEQSQICGTPPPADSELKQLRRLKHNVKKWQKRLDDIFEQLNPTPQPAQPISYTPEQLEMMKQNRSKATSILDSLERTKIY